MRKIILILISLILVSEVYAKDKKGRLKPQKGKTTVELIEEALKNGEIDEDTAILYRVYWYYGYGDLIPEQFIGVKRRRDTIVNPPLFLERSWNKLRPETKKKIKETRWRRSLGKTWRSPIVRIIHPKDNEVIYSPQISVKGIIKTPEIYKLTNVWIEVSGKRYEIKLPKPEYIPPEDTYEDEKGRKNYLKWKERYKDKPGLAELFGPPGKKLYPFTQKVRLERYGLYQIKINAENERGRADESVWIVYAKKDSKDKTPPVIKITGIKDGQKFINPRVRNVIIDINDENLAIDRMYLNGREVGGISLPVCSGERGITLHLQPGENIFEVIAIDKSGNKSSKKIKIYLEK